MGEHADDLIDRFYDEIEFEEEDGYAQPITKTCRLCKRAGLHWEQRESGEWRLCDARGIHVCPIHPIRDAPAKSSLMGPRPQ